MIDSGDRGRGCYEFFAGGGMARLGLGPEWTPLFANDICPKKAKSYVRNFPPGNEFSSGDIRDLDLQDLPGNPTLAWASFPCQDLSLAGARGGLKGKRSSTFWSFWELMEGMERQGRPLPIIVLENVVGAITSNRGEDFQTIVSTLAKSGYGVGPMVIDSGLFLPQSRPRLFVAAVKEDRMDFSALSESGPKHPWHTPALLRVFENLPNALRKHWIWWRLPHPGPKDIGLSDLIDKDMADGVRWHTEEETQRILNMMSPANRQKVVESSEKGNLQVGAIYRRTRKDSEGRSVQRAEVRFDEMSGCLRTPAGGSSRQTLLFVEGDTIRSRLLSPREAARLMGVPEWYQLPENYNEAYHLMGDGVVVPVVSWLEKHLLRPLSRGIAESTHAMDLEREGSDSMPSAKAV
ncbi:MAG: DNA cytosine methyltransferase [Candidatus Omnitrophica bacterium]|nr:DNA cytosine methyltransferase [Candidatus Omnitrophota bacterium]